MLTVSDGPKFTAGPQHVEADVGDDATLTCTVEGNPAPAVIWRKKEDEKQKILSSSTAMKLSDLQERDMGIYTCTASVMGFESITVDVHLLKKGTSRHSTVLSIGTLHKVQGKGQRHTTKQL